MTTPEIIRAKRNGMTLPDDIIVRLLGEYTRGAVPDYQMAALLMAIYFKGMTTKELAVWTRAMLQSGDVFDLSSIPGAKVDKHSTGGVGDKISIPLAPLVAACGVRVPMISGRGLGHTGGTLDKLESIPGFRTDLAPARFIEGVEKIGACMIGQTETIVPADKKLYALRDVTGTVESVPLISASIMSKKLAEGISGLVLDVKVGSGAFMKTLENARELASTLVGIGQANGVRTLAFLTDMQQPIGGAVGNALEIAESIEVLKGKGPADTVELVRTLGGAMLFLGGVADDVETGKNLISKAIDDQSGLERFRAMVVFQGGDPKVIDDPGRLPTASNRLEIPANHSGTVVGVDSEAIGMAALVLGGGRSQKMDDIDPAVGLHVNARLGDKVGPSSPLVTLIFNDSKNLSRAKELIQSAFRIGDQDVVATPLILEVIGN